MGQKLEMCVLVCCAFIIFSLMGRSENVQKFNKSHSALRSVQFESRSLLMRQFLQNKSHIVLISTLTPDIFVNILIFPSLCEAASTVFSFSMCSNPHFFLTTSGFRHQSSGSVWTPFICLCHFLFRLGISLCCSSSECLSSSS